IGVRDERRM
ncbi:hypothetical protein A2U01_0033352, partial [Trifolium medium]|nr:hypothetical protein [Trifolium medium]